MNAYARQLSAAARQYESESAYDEAAEARDEAIDDLAETIAADLLGNEDFVREALADEQPGGQEAILQDVGRFFARFQNTPGGDAAALATVAVALWRDLTPYVEAAAKDRAHDEATKQIDAMREYA